MTDSDFDAKCELENAISEKVIKLLELGSLSYKYKRKIYKAHMSICVSEFLDGLTLDSDIETALQRTALEGTCEFKWPVGTHYGGNRHMLVRLTNPSWADVFKLANEAYLDGRSIDHHFLECVNLDQKSGSYSFSFGS
jgi:hypothetical protein